MIPGPSTRYQKVTKPSFRSCSAGRPHSQAPLCLCTLRLISAQPEGTLGRLRYILGGDRPSQTPHQARFPARIDGSGLGPRRPKGGISPLPPPPPRGRALRLPPILRNVRLGPTPG